MARDLRDMDYPPEPSPLHVAYDAQGAYGCDTGSLSGSKPLGRWAGRESRR